MRRLYLYQRRLQFHYSSCLKVFFSNLGRKCIISEERFVLELPTSRAMLATARPSCFIIFMQKCSTYILCHLVKAF